VREAAGVKHDWHSFANECRRCSLQRMLGVVDPAYNIDDAHRDVLDELLAAARIHAFAVADRRIIAQRWHELDAWLDFVPALIRPRARYVAPYRSPAPHCVATGSPGIRSSLARCCACTSPGRRHTGLPRSSSPYHPAKILMAACHNFDLDAARGEGYSTALVRRPAECCSGTE
jgi:2-haloacid dehalogenase